jgi:hypothetical protein
MTVWTTLSPSIIQRSIQPKKLLKSLKEVIKSHISSSIPIEYHVKSLSRQATHPEKRSQEDPRRTFFDSPIPDTDENNFKHHVNCVVNSTSVHQHSPTCTKGSLGHIA